MSSTHALTIMHSLSEFQKSGYLCDTVIVTDDGQLRAHSAVLAAVSPVLKAALNVEESSAEHTIILTGVGLYIANIILRFIYSGDIVIPDDCLSDNNRLAEIFSVVQELRMEFPAAQKSVVEQYNDESKTTVCGEVNYTAEVESDLMNSSNVALIDAENSCMELDPSCDSQESADVTLNNGTGLGQDSWPFLSERSNKSVTRNAALPRLKKRPTCRLCGRICSSVKVLQEHCLVSHGIEDYSSIEAVPATCIDKIQLRLSRRGQVKKHPSCWTCGRVCCSLAVLKEHFAEKHSTEDQSILSDKNLLRSKAFLHQKQASLSQSDKKCARTCLLCSHCGEVFHNVLEFNDHSLTHDCSGRAIRQETDSGGARYICEMCGKVCSRPSALASHRRHHHSGDRAPHRCGHCSQTFATRKNLLRHARRHGSNDVSRLICEHCGRVFVRLVSLRDHKAREHGEKATGEADQLSFACKRCGQRFGRVSLLRRHIVELHRPATPRERSLCTLCGRSFSCKFTLMMHTRLHTGERPHRCTECDCTFATRAALRHHSLRHSNDYRHVCAICGKLFSSPSALASHARVHSGERPFSCDVCGRSFAQRCHLKQHVTLTHVKDKSLKCVVCAATFCRQVDLRRHCMRSHPAH